MSNDDFGKNLQEGSFTGGGTGYLFYFSFLRFSPGSDPEFGGRSCRACANEQQDEDVVLVLAGIHAAAQFVAALPEGGVEFGLLEGHILFSILTL